LHRAPPSRGDLKVLVFSDIPNNRLLRYDEVTGQISVLRQPSSYANGNTRDRQGRLLSCLQDERCVIRTEHDGTLTKLAAEFDGKKLNGPNDIVVRSDDSIWFTDPGYGIGSYWESTHQTNAELPRTVYRFDPKSGKTDVVSKDQVRPNGLAFSPGEKKFDLKKEVPQIGAMVETHLHEHGLSAAADASHLAGRGGSTASVTAASGTSQDAASTQKPEGPEAGFFKYGIADGIRLDEDGNIWAGTGWAGPAIDGVTVIGADGTPIGRIFLPEVVANVAFGGEKKNRLYMAGSTSLYAVYLNVAGAMKV
jgi:gluconolactonase